MQTRLSLSGVSRGALGAALCAALLVGLGPIPATTARAAPPAKGKAAADPGAEAVARVNGRPILRRDFDLAVQIQFRGRRSPIGLPELQAMRERVLERLIESELLYQEAAKGDTSVPEREVEAELLEIREGFSSADEFAAVLNENGVSEAEFKNQLRRTLMVTRFVDREVAADAAVTDEDVRRHYDQNPSEMHRGEAVRLAQILVRAAPDAPRESRAVARQKIEAILKEVRAGADFADLARRHSEGPEASRGGDTGWMVRGAGPPAIEGDAFGLAPGQISDVVESRLGYHLLKVLERRAEGPIPFEEAKERIRARLLAGERDAAIRAHVERLKEKARIERVK